MSLKHKMETLDGVDPAIAALYTKSDGDQAYYLTGIQGVVAKSKVDEFRNSNIDLQNQLAKFKDVDPAKYKTLGEEVESLRKELAKKSDVDVEKLVGERVQTMKAELDAREEKSQATIVTLTKKLESLLIDNAVRAAAIEHGIAATAVDDAVLRAKAVFRVENGEVIGYDGEKKLYDVSGTAPLPISTWVKGLEATAPHLFASSTGLGMRKSRHAGADTANFSPLQKVRAGLKS